MKRLSRSGRYASFTLVELLVVIGIIAILAGVLLAAGSAAIREAMRVKASNMAGQIQLACMAYYTDYGVYPLATNATAGTQYTYTTADTNDWENLIWALCGNINPYSPTTPVTPSVANTRSTAYLQLNHSSIDNNGVPLNPIAPTTPSYFNIALDGAYSGILNNVPVFSPGAMTNGDIAAGVYVWANCNSSSGASNVNFWVHAP